MEHLYRSTFAGWEGDRVSSMYSVDSTKMSDSTNSRPASVAPSYMNAIPARKPVTPKLTTPPRTNGTQFESTNNELPASNQAAPRVMRKGILLYSIAASPHPSAVSYIESMLKKGAYSEIVILGHVEQEAALKQLKMNIYALLGKLSLEVGVYMDLQQEWTESAISAAVSKATRSGESIYGVLCCPEFEIDDSNDLDILAFDEDQLMQPWKRSVGFMHNIAKYTLRNLRPDNQKQLDAAGYFLITQPTTQSTTAWLFRAACAGLLNLLTQSPSSIGWLVGYAEDNLLPNPEPIKENGYKLSAQAGPVDEDLGDYALPESPTKLYALWALQDELIIND